MRIVVPKRYRALEIDLRAGFERYENIRPLPGLASNARRTALVEQIIESVRRTEYPAWLTSKGVSPSCADPASDLFHPLKAAVHFRSEGQTDEAFWMLFLFVHFGRHPLVGWRYARLIYGGMSSAPRWDWAHVSAKPQQFRDWLDLHHNEIRPLGGFGNHRKYESLNGHGKQGTGAVVASYIRWVAPPRSHQDLVNELCAEAGYNPRMAFRILYDSMKLNVVRFGRLACLDFLGTASKLQLAPIEPDSAYLWDSSTGPLTGARLMFAQGETPRVLDGWLLELDRELNVGPRVLEDALCNWQKSPDSFKKFSG